MADYSPQTIEPKWQQYWQDNETFKVPDTSSKPKHYVLDMFPYPSGDGLHVGHPKGYIATDVYTRFKTMQGFSVLHPMGWDAFGLPAENYAIKNKVHPRLAVEKNIKRFKEQLSKIGFTYDWSREINTTDPFYYKWTQWIFLQLYKKGLAYESHEPINWCPKDQTGLANEDVEDGKCERCGTPVERRLMRQWVLKITDYADKLLEGLVGLEWPESIKESQRNWIGRSEGAEIDFATDAGSLTIFTTRPDTILGATYMVLAPEHPLVAKITTEANKKAVEEYQEAALNKSTLDRTDLNKDKSGVFTGGYAVNPATNEKIPIWIADYVLMSYGTGSIMGVPFLDERDKELALQQNLPIKEITPQWGIVEELLQKKIAKRSVKYKLRDWVFSRQRYWGEPIPIIHCEECGVVSVPEDQLPVMLPDVEHYEPTGTGESPLADISEWVNTTCPTCSKPAKRETNTMPQWAGSSWYYLRYIDPANTEELVDSKKEKYWMAVDMYVGGAEHATRHLIYARFWHKFLFDQGIVSTPEPFMRLQHVGLILAEGGKKMSKRWGNVINPDDIVAKYGADTLRVYEMFMGPFNEAVAWSMDSIAGPRRFLERVWNMAQHAIEQKSSEISPELQLALQKTIKRVTEDIPEFRFNTSIAALMELLNVAEKSGSVEVVEKYILLLSPFAPHMAEEVWQQLGHTESIMAATWPTADESIIASAQVTMPIQVNGKMRATIQVKPDITQAEAESLARALPNVGKYLETGTIKKVIFVSKKLLNFVVVP